MLSGGIMAGRLPPLSLFGEAAIAADHTGVENEIADLLQGIDADQSRRGTRDLERCLRNLELLLEQPATGRWLGYLYSHPTRPGSG